MIMSRCRYRDSPSATVFKFFKAKKRKKRWVTVGVRYGDANGLNSLEILYSNNTIQKYCIQTTPYRI